MEYIRRYRLEKAKASLAVDGLHIHLAQGHREEGEGHSADHEHPVRQRSHHRVRLPQKPVTRGVVREIIRDFDGLKWPSAGRWWFPALSALTVVLIAMAWFLPNHETVFGKIRNLTHMEQEERGHEGGEGCPAAARCNR